MEIICVEGSVVLRCLGYLEQWAPGVVDVGGRSEGALTLNS